MKNPIQSFNTSRLKNTCGHQIWAHTITLWHIRGGDQDPWHPQVFRHVYKEQVKAHVNLWRCFGSSIARSNLYNQTFEETRASEIIRILT